MWKRWACLLCLLPLSVLLCIGTTYARYNKSDSLATVCGSPATDRSTMSPESTVYHLGEWTRGDDRTLTHTIRLCGEAPIKGTLRFSWDAETAAAADAFVSMNVSGNGTEYTVNSQQTQVDLPFTLLLSPSDRSATVTLDVAFTPQGAAEATLFSRYLVERNPKWESGIVSTDGGFSFEAANTRFLTERLLSLSMKVPTDTDRLLLSAGANTTTPFAAGTVYYTKQYPQGVTLLTDALLTVPAENGAAAILLALNNTRAGTPLTVTAALSALTFINTVQTPADAQPLTVTSDPAVATVSYRQPLTVTLSTPSVLTDAEWNKAGNTAAQLTWRVERLFDGAYRPVTLGTDMVVAASQTVSGGTLTVTVPTGRQPAGTYRLTVEQTYHDYEIHTTSLWFFVDYR